MINKILFAGVIVLLIIYARHEKIDMDNAEYIVTETGRPDSFDPLMADKSQNASVMRMLYSSPLELDSKNLIKSNLLKHFEYNESEKKIIFQLKTNLQYSDGTKITVEDVALSISRLAYFRPDFPVVSQIEGLAEWRNSGQGLNSFPKGIRLDNDIIEIFLKDGGSNSLFRFCLELFSVIPESCIDKSTGKLKCLVPPSSGNFLIQQDLKSKIIFYKRDNFENYEQIGLKKITFIFKNLEDACKQKLMPNQVIAGSELDLYRNGQMGGCSKSDFNFYWLPSARFALLRFNPYVAPFESPKNRIIFSALVRKTLKDRFPDLLIEKSIFTKLLPGFIEDKNISIDFDEVKNNFRGKKIIIPKISFSSLRIIYEAIYSVAQNLEMKIDEEKFDSIDEITANFIDNNISVVAGGSGFWAQDPIGDLEMWLTPGLHKTMTFVWSNKEVYNLLDKIKKIKNNNDLGKKMEEFNIYLSNQCIIAPVIHYRRFYITDKNIKSINIPQSVTLPAPWQLFLVE